MATSRWVRLLFLDFLWLDWGAFQNSINSKKPEVVGEKVSLSKLLESNEFRT